MPTTLEHLSEHVVANPSQVDREAGVIFGVKIIGRISRNGREYTDNALQRAAGLYENKQVNIDHTDRNNPHADRQVHDRFGKLPNIQIRKSGLFGDLHFLKSHPLAEQVCETAERMPDVLGLSHNVDGRIVRKNGKSIVEEIERVISVDLVCDPASTSGLFESVDSEAQPLPESIYSYHLRRAKFSPASRRIVERLEAKTMRSPAGGAEMARQLR